MSDKNVVYSGRKGTRESSWHSHRRGMGKHRPKNRYEAERDVEGVSTSAKKLKTASESDINVNQSFGYCFVNFVAVFTAISNVVVCHKCHSRVTFSHTSMRGLGLKINVTCEMCDNIGSVPNSPFIRNAYELNRRIVLAMRLLGIGMNGLIKFCAFMDLPRPIFQTVYTAAVDIISVAARSVCQISMERAVKEEKEMTSAEGRDDNELTVSGDGSWRKRGFTSLFGLVSLIGWHTGKVVDIIVKSKYCKICETWEKKKDTEEYAEWLETHKTVCQSNHEGSAGKMEIDSVIEMFKRSLVCII